MPCPTGTLGVRRLPCGLWWEETEAQRFEGLARGQLGSGKDRKGLEPRAVWPWPLKCQFNLGIPPGPLLLCPPTHCTGITWGTAVCRESLPLLPPCPPGSGWQVPDSLSHFSSGSLPPASRASQPLTSRLTDSSCDIPLPRGGPLHCSACSKVTPPPPNPSTVG